jgi:hypothetical protein
MADALSRRDTEATAELTALSAPSFHIFNELHQEFDDQSSLQELRAVILIGDRGDKWQVIVGLVLVHGMVYVPLNSLSNFTRLAYYSRCSFCL